MVMVMHHCEFRDAGQFYECNKCGRRVSRSGEELPSCEPRELGDLVEKGLSAIGITKQRVSKLIGRDCGCTKHQGQLNTFSRWVKRLFRKPMKRNPKAVAVSTDWPDKIDVMYPIGTGSNWDDNELRYSIRSIVANFKPLGNLYVVGAKPRWLDADAEGLIYIPAKDSRSHDKDANIIRKTLLACEAGISQKFLAPSDDQLILLPSEAADFPPIYAGPVRHGSNTWRRRQMHTEAALKQHGLTVYDYDTHSPQIYDRDAFVEVFTKKVRYWQPPGVTINTAYFGVTQPESPVVSQGRHRRGPPGENIDAWVGGCRTIGYSDRHLRPGFQSWMAERFPTPTRFEKAGVGEWDSWTSHSIDRGTWDDIKPLIKPGMRTLEFGSGVSTRLMEAAGCRHTAVENDPRYAADSPAVLIRPLVGTPPWYDWEPPGDLDSDPFGFVLLDGPGPKFGRDGFLGIADRIISPETVILIDDTNQARYRKIAATIAKRFRLHSRTVRGRRKSWTILEPSQRPTGIRR